MASPNMYTVASPMDEGSLFPENKKMHTNLPEEVALLFSLFSDIEPRTTQLQTRLP